MTYDAVNVTIDLLNGVRETYTSMFDAPPCDLTKSNTFTICERKVD